MCHNRMSNTVNIFADKSEKLPGKEYTLMELSFKKLLDCYRNLQLQSDSLWYLICSDVVSKRLKILSDIGYILLLQKENRSHQNRQLQYWTFFGYAWRAL